MRVLCAPHKTVTTIQISALRTEPPCAPRAHSTCTPIAATVVREQPATHAPATSGSLQPLLDLDLPRLTALLKSLGLPKYKAAQVWAGIHYQGLPSFDAISTLSKSDRAVLSSGFSLLGGAGVDTQAVSTDGTVKWLFTLADGRTRVEAVFIPRTSGEKGGTLCISSQAGCTLSCSFCHTGTRPLDRNLSPGDIVTQVLLARTALAGLPRRGVGDGRFRIARVVFMGQGEPLYNWRAVSGALRILTTQLPGVAVATGGGMGLPAHRITVSTAGVAPVVAGMAEPDVPPVRLAVSLHAPTDELRSRLMGVNKQWPLDTLLRAVRGYVDASRAREGGGASADEDEGGEGEDGGWELHNGARRVRVSFEYVLLQGVNDAPSQAGELVALLTKYLPRPAIHVNLMRFHSWPGSSYDPSGEPAVAAFADAVARGGLAVTVRQSRGVDVLGACGQLASSPKGVVEKRREPI